MIPVMIPMPSKGSRVDDHKSRGFPLHAEMVTMLQFKDRAANILMNKTTHIIISQGNVRPIPGPVGPIYHT